MTDYHNRSIQPRAYSFSRIEAFDCPRRFHKLYIEKLKEPSNLPREIGLMSHEVMSHYLRWLYKNKRRLNAKILAGAVDLAISNAAEKWPLTEAEKDEAAVRLEEMFQDLMDLQWKIDPNVRAYFVEERLAFDHEWINVDWFSPGTRFRAVIDWAFLPHDEDTLHLTDHKSGWSEPDPDQLPYYAFAGWKGLQIPVKRVLVKWHFLAQSGRIQEGKWFTPEELAEVGKKIELKMAEIDECQDWGPIPGVQCGYCGFTQDCPAVEEAWAIAKVQKEAFVLDTPEKAADALELKILVAARLNELEKLLKQYVLDHGPIEASGSIMEQREKEEWLLTDPYGIQKSLKGLGVHPYDLLGHLGLSKNKLYNILKATGLTRHYGDLVSKHGEINEKTQEPRIYKAQKEEGE